MALLLLHRTGANFEHKPHSLDGLLFADSAIHFAAVALASQNAKFGRTTWYLYAIAAELSFKSLALRSGADPEECKKAGHKISKIVQLTERQGVVISKELKFKIVDDSWFAEMLETRYPLQTGSGLFVNPNYVELIAEILEIACNSPLSFEGGSAIAEIRIKTAKLQNSKEERL